VEHRGTGVQGESGGAVTQVPIGKVKDHHVNENGRCSRAVRTVIAAARQDHSTANPQTGTPNTTPKAAMAVE
jgi:hypothetical protein